MAPEYEVLLGSKETCVLRDGQVYCVFAHADPVERESRARHTAAALAAAAGAAAATPGTPPPPGDMGPPYRTCIGSDRWYVLDRTGFNVCEVASGHAPSQKARAERIAAALNDAAARVAVEPSPPGPESPGNTKAHAPRPRPPVKAEELLGRAAAALGNRGREYDAPGGGERSAGKAARMWSACTGKVMTAYEGWLFLLLLKAVRLTAAPSDSREAEDSALDGAACFSLAGEERSHEHRGTPSGYAVPGNRGGRSPVEQLRDFITGEVNIEVGIDEAELARRIADRLSNLVRNTSGDTLPSGEAAENGPPLKARCAWGEIPAGPWQAGHELCWRDRSGRWWAYEPGRPPGYPVLQEAAPHSVFVPRPWGDDCQPVPNGFYAVHDASTGTSRVEPFPATAAENAARIKP